MLNQDKYVTKEERVEAFYKFCHGKNCDLCVFAKRFHKSDCGFLWLALPYEEEKPEPCPFCGGETHNNIGHIKTGVVHYWVDCINPECMYRSAHHTDKDEAIAAHNRVCRAVEEAKKGEAKMKDAIAAIREEGGAR